MRLVLLLWTLVAPGEAELRDLVERLGDDSFEIREEAEQALQAAGRAALPLVERAALSHGDSEVRFRAGRVARWLTQIRWRTNLSGALREARETGKPLFAFSTPVELDGTSCPSGFAMRTTTFSHPAVIEFLNEHFVPVWNNHARGGPSRPVMVVPPGVAGHAPEASGWGNLRSYVASSDGTVVSELMGWFRPERFLGWLEVSREAAGGSANTIHGARALLLDRDADEASAFVQRDRRAGIRNVPAEQEADALRSLAGWHALSASRVEPGSLPAALDQARREHFAPKRR